MPGADAYLRVVENAIENAVREGGGRLDPAVAARRITEAMEGFDVDDLKDSAEEVLALANLPGGEHNTSIGRMAAWAIFYGVVGENRETSPRVESLDILAAGIRSSYGADPDEIMRRIPRQVAVAESKTDLDSWKVGHAISALRRLPDGYEAADEFSDRMGKYVANLMDRLQTLDEARFQRGALDGAELGGQPELGRILAKVYSARYTPQEEEAAEVDDQMRDALAAGIARAYVRGGIDGVREYIAEQERRLSERGREVQQQLLTAGERVEALGDIRDLAGRIAMTTDEEGKLSLDLVRYDAARRAALGALSTIREAISDLAAVEYESSRQQESPPAAPDPGPAASAICARDVLSAIASANAQMIHAQRVLESALEQFDVLDVDEIDGLSRQEVLDKIALLEERLRRNDQVAAELMEYIALSDGEPVWTGRPPDSVRIQTTRGTVEVPITVSGHLEMEVRDLPDGAPDAEVAQRLNAAADRLAVRIGNEAPKAFEYGMANAATGALSRIAGSESYYQIQPSIRAITASRRKIGRADLFDETNREAYRKWLVEVIRMSGLAGAVEDAMGVDESLETADVSAIKEALGTVFSRRRVPMDEVRRRFVKQMRRRLAASGGWMTPENRNGVPPEVVEVFYEEILYRGRQNPRSNRPVELDPEPSDQSWVVPGLLRQMPDLKESIQGVADLEIASKKGDRASVVIDAFVGRPVACGVVVVDGDTVYAVVPTRVRDRTSGEEFKACARIRVRMKGYDAAELGSPTGLGRQARDLLQSLVRASTDSLVVLDSQTPVQVGGRGQGSRTIGSLVLEMKAEDADRLGVPEAARLGSTTTDQSFILVDAGQVVASRTEFSRPTGFATSPISEEQVAAARQEVVPGAERLVPSGLGEAPPKPSGGATVELFKLGGEGGK